MNINLTHRRAMTGSALALLALLLIAVLVLANAFLRVRIDLTENHQYSLSPGTHKMLADIPEPINLYFYYSDRGTADMPMLRTYAARVREMLEEMVADAAGQIRLTVVDPLPFSEEEDRAVGYGIQAVPAGKAGENIYFGLAGTNSTDGLSVIPFFQPDKESFLEYDLIKLVHSLVVGKKPVIGVITGLNMAGGFDPGTRSATDGWAVYQELSDQFDLRVLNAASLSSIPEDVSALWMVHPKAPSEDLQYAVDQFLLRGGRLVLFVDPNADSDQSGQDPSSPEAMFARKSSDLPKLFEAWGVAYDPNQVVLDAGNALPVQVAPNQPPVRHLAILGLGRDSLNKDEVATAQLQNLNMASSGQFRLTESSSLKLTPLVQSSGDSMLVGSDRLKLAINPADLYDGFSPSNEHYVLAGRLDGPLKSAFPERSDAGHLAESKDDVHILMVADSDLLTDRLWVQVSSFFGQKVMNAFANNGDFAINAVDNLAGSSALIGIRGRAGSARPFTTVEALKRQADQRFRAKEEELQQQLTDTEARLTQLQSGKSSESALIMSPEQQAEVEKFQQQKVQIRKDLRQVRRQLDADIEALGSKLKFINIVLVPLLLTLTALAFVGWRKRRHG
ncbi:MAG: Gldg family protein [Lysobacterales bacterium]